MATIGTINVRVGRDCGCEITDDEFADYLRRCVSAIADAYADADVDVEECELSGTIVSNTLRGCGDVNESVYGIVQDVWEACCADSFGALVTMPCGHLDTTSEGSMCRVCAVEVIASSKLDGYDTREQARNAAHECGSRCARTEHIPGRGWYGFSSAYKRPDGTFDRVVYGAGGRFPRLGKLPTWTPED
jgi:hypothetical protein